jgi:histone H3/H4
MEHITKPSITRLVRKAGVKSMSEDCYPVIRNLIQTIIEDIVSKALIMNSEHSTKTLMNEDIYEALSFMGYNVGRSDCVGSNTLSK